MGAALGITGTYGVFPGGTCHQVRGELPVTGSVHLEPDEHPWPWCWVSPAQVGSELGSEAPTLVLEPKEPQAAAATGLHFGGTRVWEPICHVWIRLAIRKAS